jgi:uncharacterized SAM-binding protein YcdF (DUF218 family)
VKAARAATAATIGVAAWILAAPLAARALVVAAPIPADALIVLSGSPLISERTTQAIAMFRRGGVRLILLTDDGTRGRWSRRLQQNPRSIDRASGLLMDAGIPPDRVIKLPPVVSSTHDEALAARTFLLARRLNSVVIVTSPYHSRRALWTFRRALSDTNIRVGIAPAETLIESPGPSWWWLTARGWQVVGAEYPKLLYYVFRYRRPLFG